MRHATRTDRHSPARGLALVAVLLALATLGMILSAVQVVSFRQAAAGRQTLARMRAFWAARAGIESTLASLESGLQGGAQVSAYAIPDAMLDGAAGEVEGATWTIAHAQTGLEAEERDGPGDPHAKVNINRMTRNDLMQLEQMTEDVADSILDWIDDDDTPGALGAEAGYYSQLPSPYEPRNGPMTSLWELELVAGVSSDLVRGEDWNLNGRLDANEDDGDESWPPDNADGALDAGWSANITASSLEPTLAISGQTKLNLTEGTSDDLIARVPSLDSLQAQTILDYASRGGARLEDLISTNLSQIAGQGSTVRNLRDDQLRALFDECVIAEASAGPQPGRINLNTVERETLDYVTAIPPGVADALILARDAAPTGFTNMMDLLEIPSMTPRRVTTFSSYLTVEAGSYVITSTGRDGASGIESRVSCVVWTGELPVVIVEQRVR